MWMKIVILLKEKWSHMDKFHFWYLFMNGNHILKWKVYRTFFLLGPKDYRNFRRTRLKVYLVENARKQLYTMTKVPYKESGRPQKRKRAENRRTLEEPPGSRHTGQRKLGHRTRRTSKKTKTPSRGRGKRLGARQRTRGKPKQPTPTRLEPLSKRS